MNAATATLLITSLYVLPGLLPLLPIPTTVVKAVGGYGCSLSSLIVAIYALCRYDADSFSISSSWEFGPLGNLSFGGDSLTWLFVLIIAVLSAIAGIYSVGYYTNTEGNGNRKSLAFHYLCLNFFVASMIMVVFSRSALSFLASWEIMAISSFFLVLKDGTHESTRRAALTYVIITHIATAFIISAFMLLAGATHNTSFDVWASSATSLTPTVRLIVFLCLSIGLGTKAGLMPFHIWLPKAHPEAPSHISALMSGAMVKTAIYGFVRFIPLTLGVRSPWWGAGVIAIGICSAVLGALGMQLQHSVKRILAYSTIENMGIVAIGIGVSMVGIAYNLSSLTGLAMTAALAHCLFHSVYKGLLFLGAGSLQHGTETLELSHLGGLHKTMPVTAITFLVGTLSISALPPLPGFISEWLSLKSGFSLMTSTLGAPSRLLGFVVISSLALTGGLVAAAFVRLYGVTFLGLSRSSKVELAHESPITMKIAMSGAAVICIGLGLFPRGTLFLVSPAIKQLGLSTANTNSVHLPSTVGIYLAIPLFIALVAYLFHRPWLSKGTQTSETWNCGAPLEPQMQYSSGGFAQPFNRVFTHRPTVEQRIYRPLRDTFGTLGDRLARLQSGSIQAYISYILVALIVLLALAR